MTDALPYARHAVDLAEHARVTFTTEDDVQAGLAAVFSSDGWVVTREFRLGRAGRIDLFLDRPGPGDVSVARIGVEVKVAGSPESVARQLQRYARSGACFDALILATTRPTHRDLPDTLGGKPLLVAVIAGGAW